MRELDFHNWMLKIKNKYYANDKLMDLAFERIREYEKV
jgi:hypothetical protein